MVKNVVVVLLVVVVKDVSVVGCIVVDIYVVVVTIVAVGVKTLQGTWVSQGKITGDGELHWMRCRQGPFIPCVQGSSITHSGG